MGGKQKNTQRTKGNVRPSSSAKAAALLETSGGASMGFVGFGTMSDLGYVPTTGGEEADSSVDSDFRMVLRKLSKRDATTKIKALQEFSSFCKEKDVEAVKSVLPFWPRIYNKVAIDHDRRVREASQHAFGALVIRVRRDVAPHLKGLMGCWLAAQNDVYAPVSSAARAAFVSAFPPAKQTEALTFCREVIIAHIQDNLFAQTAQTLSDPKTTDKEDMESKYEKVLASNLGALRMFVTTVPVENQQPVQQELRNVLSEPKFWKLAKHKANTIRCTFYTVLSAFCQVHPELANEQAAKISPLILHNLDETDPLIGPALWEAVLYTVTVIEDCWSHVNPRKGMLPKLWSMLKDGGGGSAAAIYPNLLPLLSKLPQAVIGENALGFYAEFFTNMKTGLCLDKVGMSVVECNAICKALFECAQYLITHSLHTDTALCQYIVTDQILPLVQASIVEKSSNLTSAVHPLFVEFLAPLLHLSTSDEKALSLFNDLWQAFSDLCKTQVTGGNERILEQLGDLLTCFKEGRTLAKKKSSRVKFTEEVDEECLSERTEKLSLNTPARQEVKDTKLKALVTSQQLLTVISDISKATYGKSRDSAVYVHLFSRLCKTYIGVDLMKVLLEGSGESEGFLKEVVLPLMQHWEGKENLRKVTKDLVDVFISVYKSVEEKQGIDMLELSLQSLSHPVMLHRLLVAVVALERQSVTRSWMRGDVLGGYVMSWVQELMEMVLAGTGGGDGEKTHEEREAYWGILSIAVASGENKEPIIGVPYIEQILGKIQQTIPTPSVVSESYPEEIANSINSVCDVAGIFFSNFKTCYLGPPAESLLLTLFELSCRDDHTVPAPVMDKVKANWQLGIKANMFQKGGLLTEDSFLKKAARHLKNLVLCDVHTMARLERVCDIAIAFGSAISSVVGSSDDGFQNATVSQLFSADLLLPFTHSILPKWASGPVVSRQIFLDDCPPTSSKILPNSIPSCMAPIAFTSQLLVTMATDGEDGENTEDNEESTEEEIRRKRQRQELIVDMAYAAAFGSALLGARKDALKTSELAKVSMYLEKNLGQLLDRMDNSEVKDVFMLLIRKSLSQGHLWASAIGQFLGQVKEHQFDLLALCGGMTRFSNLDLPGLHSLDSLLPFLSKDDVTLIAELQAAQIISIPQQGVLQDGVRQLYLYNKTLERVPPTPDVTIGVLAAVYEWRQHPQNEDLFAFDSDVTSLSWSALCLNVESIRLLTLLVQHIPTALNDKHWDFVLCSLAAWIQSISESDSSLSSSLPVQYFSACVCDLLYAVAHCLDTVWSERKDSFPATIATDWEEFFCPTLYGTVLPLFVNLASVLPSPSSSTPEHVLLSSVSQAASTTPRALLLEHSLPPRLVAEDEGEPQSPELLSLLNHLTGLLTDGRRHVQAAAFTMLKRLMVDVVAADEAQMTKEVGKDDDGTENIRCPCRALMAAMDTGSQVLELVLKDVAVGECMAIDPHIDEYTFSTAYVLSWELLLKLFKAASSELRAQYACYLRSISAVDGLLVNLFRLMPDPPMTRDKVNMFSQKPEVKGSCSSESLQWLACRVYYHCLQDLPAIIRQCWANQENRIAGIIEQYTTKHVSGVLSSEEIRAIQGKKADMENMTIQARPGAREVVATYTVDEVSMELVVTLSPSHPLVPLTVDSGKRVGVAAAQWRNWMLQLCTFLTHQNGSILDGLMLWKKNVDKRFEGVDDCMICYSVIHGATCQLPRLQCRTCKKRFHSACLYKWFSTSNNSSCPLCRNLF